MSSLLKAFLADIRQHPAFPELLRAVERPQLPRFRPKSGDTAESMGARSIFESGRQAQHDLWLTALTGVPHSGEETKE